MGFSYSGPPEFLRQKVEQLPLILAGKLPDPTGAVRLLMLRLATVLLGLIKDAYVIKSLGGTDALGVQWKPLSPTTLALRRIVATPKTVAKLKARLKLLSPERRALLRQHARQLAPVLLRQDEKNRRQALKILGKKFRRGEITASAFRAKQKQLQSLTRDQAKKAALAGAYAEILRDTGRLLNSLNPTLKGVGDQFIRLTPGTIEIGTNVPYAQYHQSPGPRKLKKDGTPLLPRRQFLPDENQPLPEPWAEALSNELAKGLSSNEFWSLYLR